MVCKHPRFLFCHKKTNEDGDNNSMPSNNNDSTTIVVCCYHMSTNDNDHKEGWEVPPFPLTLLLMVKKPNQLISQAHGDGSYCTPCYFHLLMLLKGEGKKERKVKKKGGL